MRPAKEQFAMRLVRKARGNHSAASIFSQPNHSHSMNPPSNPTRRDFLKASGALAVASAIGLPHETRAADLAGKKIKVGFIGCGGRGTGAANQTLQADSNIELWAMGDVFRDKIDSSLEILKAQFEKQPDKLNV